ncbi:MAG: HU family DNA-binding protein [Pseudodesulfovibrio sp.]
MTKAEVIDQVATRCNITKKQASDSLKGLLDIVQSELAAGNKLTLTGFGSFSVSDRKARVGRNPQTGKEIKIAARKVPGFKAGKALKDAVK